MSNLALLILMAKFLHLASTAPSRTRMAGRLDRGILTTLRLPVRLEAALGLDLVTRGGVELSSVVALDPALHGMAGGGLRRLAAAVLGVTLDKAVEVRCSDWEAATLSAEQVRK